MLDFQEDYQSTYLIPVSFSDLNSIQLLWDELEHAWLQCLSVHIPLTTYSNLTCQVFDSAEK